MMKKILNTKNKGFTLIELLVVISILGVLAVLVIVNINEARARARDVRKKEDMSQLRTALKLYYSDYYKYPDNCTLSLAGCGTDGDSCCPTSGCPEFSAGTNCATVYMNKLPTGLANNTISYRSDGNDKFCIKATLENASDPDMASSYSGCGSVCTALGVTLKTTEYYICSD